MKEYLMSETRSPWKTIIPILWLMPLVVYMGIYLEQKPLSAIQALNGFSIASENLLLWFGLLLTSVIVLLSPKAGAETPETKSQPSLAWLISFALPFVLLVSLVVYVNPHGRYPWRFYPFTTTAAHYQKIELYDQLSQPPQVIVLGSSHTYTISAAYITQSLGKETFNMAVGSAGPMDELILSRYLIKNSTELPRLFIVELVATDLGTSAWQNYMPLNLLPYISLNNAYPIIKSTFLDTLSLHSLIDSLFLLTNRNAKEYITFLPDGTGVRSDRSESFYENNVKKQIPAVLSQNSCAELDAEGQKAIAGLVELAEQNKIGIVFYRSPINAEFFDQANLGKPLYQKCQRVFQEYMQGLVDTHPNVFYMDLQYYEPVSSLREAGYIDAQHLHPGASNLVIDALHPELEKALLWVDEYR